MIPDFVIGDVDSLGIRWVLVELETPESSIYLSNSNTLDKFARCGVDQIIEWRHWLSENVAYAHKSPRQNGLGLFDISAQSQGLVLVGRRRLFPIKTKDAKRLHLRQTDHIQVHTYDWLVERLRGAIAHRGPPASNPHLLHKASPDPGYRVR